MGAMRIGGRGAPSGQPVRHSDKLCHSIAPLSNPVRQEFGRTFCRMDRRVPCSLAPYVPKLQ
jgi:hypothetical protein